MNILTHRSKQQFLMNHLFIDMDAQQMIIILIPPLTIGCYGIITITSGFISLTMINLLVDYLEDVHTVKLDYNISGHFCLTLFEYSNILYKKLQHFTLKITSVHFCQTLQSLRVHFVAHEERDHLSWSFILKHIHIFIML